MPIALAQGHSLAGVTLGEIVPTAVAFRCVARHHPTVDEVRLERVQEVADRRYRDGVRLVRAWAGYCACCGRRVTVEPFAS